MGPSEPSLLIVVVIAMIRSFTCCVLLAVVVAGCTDSVTSSEAALRSHGYSEVYVNGYHDGCQSGKAAGGDLFSDRVRNETAYGGAGDYKPGWDYGFVTCRDSEIRNLAIASTIGTAIAVGSSHGADGIDVRGTMAGIDTSAIQAAGW